MGIFSLRPGDLIRRCCPSVGQSVGPSVGRSVRPSVRPSVIWSVRRSVLDFVILQKVGFLDYGGRRRLSEDSELVMINFEFSTLNQEYILFLNLAKCAVCIKAHEK